MLYIPQPPQPWLTIDTASPEQVFADRHMLTLRGTAKVTSGTNGKVKLVVGNQWQNSPADFGNIPPVIMEATIWGPLTMDGFGYYVAPQSVQLRGQGGWVAGAYLMKTDGVGAVDSKTPIGTVTAPLPAP